MEELFIFHLDEVKRVASVVSVSAESCPPPYIAELGPAGAVLHVAEPPGGGEQPEQGEEGGQHAGAEGVPGRY